MMNNIEYVVKKSNYVKIDYNKIKKLSENLRITKTDNVFTDIKGKYSDEKIVRFLILCESINFCYWTDKTWEFKYKEKTYKSSIGLFMAIQKKLENNPSFFELCNLKKINIQEFKKIFLYNGKCISLINERYKAFVRTIKVLKKKENSIFKEIFNAKSDVGILNCITKNFPNYRDYSYYNFRKIKFNKRATLLVRDLYEMIPSIKNNIQNIINLTACADYVIPKLLNNCGILEYNNKLMTKILQKEQIRHNSKMEIEIRANMIFAVEQINKYLKLKNVNISSVELDGFLWKYAKTNNIKGNPHHRTKTIFY